MGTKISGDLWKKGYCSIPYIAEIPVENGRIPTLNYLLGWIEGVYTNTSGLLKGFYWYYEYPWQVVNGHVPGEYLREISEKVHEWSLQLIWIPYLHESIYSPDFSSIVKRYGGDVIKALHFVVDHTDLSMISEYFTHICSVKLLPRKNNTDKRR